ncbi:MAG: cytochrome-c peroxidase [Flavobacteriales bacterium]|nr:cytochrome-c peroxidase [Flavobacteriales bacterium]
MKISKLLLPVNNSLFLRIGRKKTVVFLLFFVILQSSFLINDGQNIYNEKVRSSYKALSLAASEFNTSIEENLPKALIQKRFSSLRLAFKRNQMILDYLYPEYNYLFLNGPPFPKWDEQYFDGIVNPQGLQVIEELLDTYPSSKNDIKSLSASFLQSLNKLEGTYLQTEMSHVRIIEAMQSELIRIYCLGLTGFDTPSSEGAMDEAKAGLATIQEYFELLEREFSHINNENSKEIVKLLSKAISTLNKSDFKHLDRLKFLKLYVDPLNAKLRVFQSESGIALKRSKTHAQNYASKSLFSADFLLDEYYFQYTFHPLNDEKAVQLGKMLFFDPVLSKSVDASCASCHQPNKGFTDGKRFSQLKGKEALSRNTPGLINSAFATRFFWDMRELNLERQVSHVIQNSEEFDISYNEIIDRLEGSSQYKSLFRDIYGDFSEKPINNRSINNALAAYVNSLQGFNSRFDQYVRGESKSIDPLVKDGYNLFMGEAACGTCHFAPTFSGVVPPFYEETESEVLGVLKHWSEQHPILNQDSGRIINGIKKDHQGHFYRSFKTMTVRNAELTSPYMHNGSLETLEQVIEFYDRGGGEGMGLVLENQTLSSEPLELDELEKKSLIAFINSLTDTSGTTSIPYVLPDIEKYPHINRNVTY